MVNDMKEQNEISSRFEVLSLFLPGWLWPGPSWSESGPTRSQAAAFSSLRPRPPLWPLVIFVSAVDFPPRRDMCGITGTCHEDKECTQFHRSHFVDWAWIHFLRQSCVPCDDKWKREKKRIWVRMVLCFFSSRFARLFLSPPASGWRSSAFPGFGPGRSQAAASSSGAPSPPPQPFI